MTKPTQTKNSKTARVPPRAPKLPAFNALKHGRRSGWVLVPGDDVEDFRALRRRSFHLHKPRTIEEALCVETIVACHWRIFRCRREQAAFKQQLGAAMSGHPDATGYLCDPDPHRLHHRGVDCGIEEARLARMKDKALAQLGALQKQRTQNLTLEGAGALEDYTVFLAEGEPLLDGEPVAAAPSATGSNARGNGKIFKRTQWTPGMPFPRHWSRAQRDAALQRMAARHVPHATQAPAQAAP